MSLRLACINIEGAKHLESVKHFIALHEPDVVCMQEVYAQDVPKLEQALEMTSVHVANADVSQEVGFMPARGPWGVATFSALPIMHQEHHVYVGNPDTPPIMQPGNPNSCRRTVQVVEFQKAGDPYRIANTHFTWTPDGNTSPEQLQDMQKLSMILDRYEALIFVGDLNAPRGKEVFSHFAERYTDNIPQSVTSTLDPDLHRAGALPLVVDAFFTTPQYSVEEIAVHTGVSDHRAILAEVRYLRPIRVLTPSKSSV